MEHVHKMLWKKTTQDHYNNISLGDLHECCVSISMSSISTLVSECMLIHTCMDLPFSQCGVQCLYAFSQYPFPSLLIKSSSKKRTTESHQNKHVDRYYTTFVHSSTCLWIWISNIQYYTCTTSEQIWRKDSKCLNISVTVLLTTTCGYTNI